MEENNLHINQLLVRCKKSDKNAQMQIYKDYYKAMYNISLRILRNAFEAEDVIQEAFLTAFIKVNTFKGEVAFGSWLKRIVINKSLTQLKKNNKYSEVKKEVFLECNLVVEETINYSNLKASKVMEKLNLLKDNYRIILILSFD